MADDDESPWYRPLLMGVGALVGVAIIVGGVISLVALGAVTFSGLGSADSAASQKPSLYFPTHKPGAKDLPQDPGVTLADLNGGKKPSASPSATPSDRSPKPHHKPKPPPSVISLSASPTTVSPMQKIYLSGTYPGGEGASLQVQRYQGGWRPFPASTSVSGGTFSTYVMTGQSGANKFRVVDTGSGKKSNAVTVTVR